MKRPGLLPLALGLLLAHTAQAAAPACPSAKFPAFFAKYADSIALQKTYTADPLAISLLDYAVQPEPRQVSKQLARNSLSFPLIPPAPVRKRQGLALRLNQVDDNNASATLFKEETGYKVTYVFRKDACWKLERRDDQSL